MSNKSYWEQRSNIAYSLATRKIEKPLKKLYVKVFRNIKEELIEGIKEYEANYQELEIGSEVSGREISQY